MAVKQSNKAFGLTFAGMFAALAAIGFVAFHVTAVWALAAAAAFLAQALFLPSALLPLNRLWQRLGQAVGHVSNHMLLGLFFYGLITPVGAAMRAIGTDPMNRRYAPEAETYFSSVGRQATTETYCDMF